MRLRAGQWRHHRRHRQRFRFREHRRSLQERRRQRDDAGDFLQEPPKAPNPEAAEAIKASCRPKVLDVAGDAALFDKGDGLYHVVFKRPVRNGDICPQGTTPQSICGNFAAGDKMHSSRINAG